MKKLFYISLATVTLTFSSFANATPNPLSKGEMSLVISAICSIDANYSQDDIKAAIKEVNLDNNITDSRVNQLSDVAMMMQMMPGNVEGICSQHVN